MTEWRVRAGTLPDLPQVMTILDGAGLATDFELVRSSLADEHRDRETVVAAVDGRVIGVLVRAGRRIHAIAVRRARRGQGIGTALVETVASRLDGPLEATCDDDVRAFYVSLGFDIYPGSDNRLRCRLPATPRGQGASG